MSDYLMLFMFLRLLFLIRSTFNYSIYRDGYSKAICQHYGASSGIRFAFKCFLDQYPQWTIIWMFTLTILVLAYLLRVFENPYYVQLTIENKYTRLTWYEDVFQFTYCIIVTITSVGYGDITAKSFFGKSLLMFASLWGTFLISLVLLMVANVFEIKDQ